MSALDKLHPGLQRWIKEQNWRGLTPIQVAALEPILEGRSCVIEAPTAGGKTEAALFPSLTRTAGSQSKSVRVLYIAPLRALLNNLEVRASTYASVCFMKAFKWHGDVSQHKKVNELKSPPELLLTTPESVEAILLRKAEWRDFFADLETVIIDEAHNLAAGDRGSHLLSLLERLEAGTGSRPQRIALSATIGNPEEMCRWLTGRREAAVRIKVDRTVALRQDFLVGHYDGSADTADTPASASRGHAMLRSMVNEIQGKRSITFVRSRNNAEGISTALDKFTKGRVKVRTHHGNVGKYYREQAELLIKLAGEDGINSIVSTSTLELGIDIGELDAVLQVGALASPSSFLQRVGRTGRRRGAKQYFRGFTQSMDELLLLAATVSLGLEHRSEKLNLSRNSMHILAHQVLCLSLQEHGIEPDTAWNTLHKAYVYSDVTRGDYNAMIRHMLQEQYLRVADGLLVAGEKAEKRYLVAGWRHLFATFNSAPLYDVMIGRTQVGTLDTAFVSSLEVPFVFSLGGRPWRALEVDHDSRTVKAVAAAGGSAPKWAGFGGPEVPFETAQRVGEILNGYLDLPDVLDSAARGTLSALVDSSRNGWQPGGTVINRLADGHFVLTTYAGDAINRTLSRLMEAAGFKAKGDYASVQVDNGNATPDELAKYLGDLKEQIAAGSADELAAVLASKQPILRFSPFAPMLPENLLRKVLVNATTDLNGLRTYVNGADQGMEV